MLAMQCEAFATPAGLRLRNLAEPVVGQGELLVQVAACGLGFVDALIAEGRYQLRPTLPFVPGSEIAGTVVAIGPGVEGFRAGDRVVGVARSGGLAQRALISQSFAALLPDSVGTHAAAACLTNYCTALMALADLGAGRPGEYALILGAGGGLGMAAIDVARWRGLRPIAAASTEGKRDAARTQGAVVTADYCARDWRARLEEKIGKANIGLIFDTVGGAMSETSFRMLKPGGRHLVLGFASGEIARLPLNLPLLKRSSVIGVDWGGALRAERSIFAPMVAHVLQGLSEGALRPILPAPISFDEAPAVMASLGARQWQGKMVVRILEEDERDDG